MAFQGVSKYSWQTIGNVMSLISGLIAGGLYGNIGLKIAYVNIVEDLLHGPPLLSPKGRYAWSALVVAFWSIGMFCVSTSGHPYNGKSRKLGGMEE